MSKWVLLKANNEVENVAVPGTDSFKTMLEQHFTVRVEEDHVRVGPGCWYNAEQNVYFYYSFVNIVDEIATRKDGYTYTLVNQNILSNYALTVKVDDVEKTKDIDCSINYNSGEVNFILSSPVDETAVVKVSYTIQTVQNC